MKLKNILTCKVSDSRDNIIEGINFGDYRNVASEAVLLAHQIVDECVTKVSKLYPEAKLSNTKFPVVWDTNDYVEVPFEFPYSHDEAVRKLASLKDLFKDVSVAHGSAPVNVYISVVNSKVKRLYQLLEQSIPSYSEDIKSLPKKFLIIAQQLLKKDLQSRYNIHKVFEIDNNHFVVNAYYSENEGECSINVWVNNDEVYDYVGSDPNLYTAVGIILQVVMGEDPDEDSINYGILDILA